MKFMFDTGNAEKIENLLKNITNIRDPDGFTPLYVASMNGNFVFLTRFQYSVNISIHQNLYKLSQQRS